MKKEEIENYELKRLITMKRGKLDFSEITQNDLESITEITLRAYLINGEESGIDLKSVLAFPNLERLKVSRFEITSTFIEYLLSLEKLESLEIFGCTFKDVDFSKLNRRIKSISFSTCEDLPFEYPNVESVRVVKSNIDFGRINFAGVKNIFIQNSNVKNVRSLSQYESIKTINLDGSKLYDENGSLLEDIEIGKDVVYSHERESYNHDNYRG